MRFVRSALRYAHTKGYTSLTYTKTGDYIITCGADGDIRRWACISDDDPYSNCLGEFVRCVVHTGDNILAATDNNTVQSYEYPSIDINGTLLRFTAPANCLCVQGNYVAAASDDTKIKILNTENNSLIELEGHIGPVLALDIYEPRNLLASIAGDGMLKIWQLDNTIGVDNKNAELKSFNGLAKINGFEYAKIFGSPCFEPSLGNELAYVNGKEIIVLNTNNWEIQYTLTDEQIASNYTCCKFSTDGQKIVAGTILGELSVFDVKQRKTLTVDAAPNDAKTITSVAWNPAKKDEIGFCDISGMLGTIYISHADNEDKASAANYEQDELLDGFEFENENDNSNSLFDNEAGEEYIKNNMGADDDDDDEHGNCVSLEKLKSKIMNNAVNGSANVANIDDDESKQSARSESVYAMPTIETFKQSAFQPSSTPLELEHRYLVWNRVGIVTAHMNPNTDGSIDVEFHDASVHHSLQITNYQQHNIASLSTAALVLSSYNSTKLVVIALAASGNKEWSINLPDCESVEAVTATTKLIAVATSMYFLRLYTVMGTQREVLSIPGPVVAVAGHEHSILVVYHSSSSNIEQQHLAAMLIHTSGLNLHVQNMCLPLTPGRTMSWLGYTDCGSPVFVDSMGLVQFYRLRSNAWYPICDTLKLSSSVSNTFFVISVSERTQIIQAVLCRSSAYPMTNPRPMLQELPMQLPLCDIETEKSELEDVLMRAAIMQMTGHEKLIKETAIKLFALACRSECEARAKDLIETMSCTELLQLAVKYASKLGRIHLSDRLCELLPQLELELELRNQRALEYSNGTVTPIFIPMVSNSATTTPKLAPKVMELSATKRGALKRYSQAAGAATNASPNGFKSILNTAKLQDPPLDTQENIFGSETQTDIHSLNNGEQTVQEEQQRTPLNSINPFARKRKLTHTDVIFGSEKLKLAKK